MGREDTVSPCCVKNDDKIIFQQGNRIGAEKSRRRYVLIYVYGLKFVRMVSTVGR